MPMHEEGQINFPQMNQQPLPHRTQRILRRAGFFMLGVYVVWNAFWISSGQIPPSLFYSWTGVPCPTTGGTRSFLSLLDGKIYQSFMLNPMTVPIIGLLLATLIRVSFLFCVREKVELANSWLIAWVAVLGIAWTAKLLLFMEILG